MYHFVVNSDQPATALLINGKTVAHGYIRQYLKNFQVDGIRFILNRLLKHEYCVLNDECGLGKTATAAVVLGAIGVKNKKCLLVLQNEDKFVDHWQFHLSILTSVPFTVINNGKDSTDTPHNVYIAKWNTLRIINDLTKFKFDYVIIDNRGLILDNNFCTSMLIKNFEKKVNFIISSVDITCNLKLTHNILRLFGGLEHKYESFKAFETKFKLPDAKDIFSKNIDLEVYFLKREMLIDYCRDFRLRRYRHQFETDLPLCDSTSYNINLELWRDTNNSRNKTQETLRRKTLNNQSSTSLETDTQEVFQQFVNIKQTCNRNNPSALTMVQIPLENISDNGNLSEETFIMEPLVISDSEDDITLSGRRQRNSDDSDVIEIISLINENLDNYENNAVNVPTESVNAIQNIEAQQLNTKMIDKDCEKVNTRPSISSTSVDKKKCENEGKPGKLIKVNTRIERPIDKNDDILQKIINFEKRRAQKSVEEIQVVNYLSKSAQNVTIKDKIQAKKSDEHLKSNKSVQQQQTVLDKNIAKTAEKSHTISSSSNSKNPCESVARVAETTSSNLVKASSSPNPQMNAESTSNNKQLETDIRNITPLPAVSLWGMKKSESILKCTDSARKQISGGSIAPLTRAKKVRKRVSFKDNLEESDADSLVSITSIDDYARNFARMVREEQEKVMAIEKEREREREREIDKAIEEEREREIEREREAEKEKDKEKEVQKRKEKEVPNEGYILRKNISKDHLIEKQSEKVNKCNNDEVTVEKKQNIIKDIEKDRLSLRNKTVDKCKEKESVKQAKQKQTIKGKDKEIEKEKEEEKDDKYQEKGNRNQKVTDNVKGNSAHTNDNSSTTVKATANKLKCTESSIKCTVHKQYELRVKSEENLANKITQFDRRFKTRNSKGKLAENDVKKVGNTAIVTRSRKHDVILTNKRILTRGCTTMIDLTTDKNKMRSPKSCKVNIKRQINENKEKNNTNTKLRKAVSLENMPITSKKKTPAVSPTQQRKLDAIAKENKMVAKKPESVETFKETQKRKLDEKSKENEIEMKKPKSVDTAMQTGFDVIKGTSTEATKPAEIEVKKRKSDIEPKQVVINNTPTQNLEKTPSNDKATKKESPTKAASPSTAGIKKKQKKILGTQTDSAGCVKITLTSDAVLKKTRSMQRMMRSTQLKNKYMHTTVAIDLDHPTKRKKPKINNKIKEIISKNIKAKQTEKLKNKQNITDNKKAEKNSEKEENEDETSNNAGQQEKDKQIAVNTERNFDEMSLVSSTFEDIQCGQKFSLTSSSSGQSIAAEKSKFIIPPTPQVPTQLTDINISSLFNDDNDIILIQPSASVRTSLDDIIILSSSEDKCSQSSQSRRTLALKQKQKKTTINKCTATATAKAAAAKPRPLPKSATKRKMMKSPDLFSNYSDLNGLTNTPFEGFKIFGSEVKQLQQQHALISSTAAASDNRPQRSCLDILEQIFEQRSNDGKQKNTLQTQKNSTNKTCILPAHPIEAATAALTCMKEKQQQIQQPQTNKKKSLPKPATRKAVDVNEDDIFEITNNGTFGSLMRVNADGEISPVQQQLKITTQQHNKITKYLIGQTQPPTVDTPTKKSPMTGTINRKSPKAKSTQTTKLTKWFRKNSQNDVATRSSTPAIENTNEHSAIRTRRAAVKRRRLELSFKS